LYLSLRVRDLLVFVLAALLAVPAFVMEERLLRVEVFFEVEFAAAGFLPGVAFWEVFVAETLFLPVALLFAAGFFLDLLSPFAAFFV
jgi:hypothetical protein